MRYKTKAEWAAAKAAELQQQAFALPTHSSHDWRAVKGRMRAQETLLAESWRYARMAERLRA